MQARMRQASLFTAVAITLAVAFGGTALAQSVGTRKLNLAKSKYQQGQAPKSTILVYEAVGAGIKVTVDSVLRTAPQSTTPTRRTMTGRIILSLATQTPVWPLARG